MFLDHLIWVESKTDIALDAIFIETGDKYSTPTRIVGYQLE